MIFVGLGANLVTADHGTPREALAAALEALSRAGLRIVARSSWYESAPVPASDQPWFVNGVVRVTGGFDPAELLALLHRTEAAFGRVRRRRNEARVLDLDLLAYGDIVLDGADGGPFLPHPRMADRAFVLLPLAEIAPGWRHPATGQTVEALIAALPPGQAIRPMAEET
ncbi:MAG: 2-amino-4-hydroxy-6-hydroxymethyldihydropteridine diphosphokinase [Proteobacteria bacterium]|nr:2-amino-4-hydroxy-6-hydroxymethyldihydropteridine diphosphokinase [Pseudomonadota bacterium]